MTYDVTFGADIEAQVARDDFELVEVTYAPHDWDNPPSPEQAARIHFDGTGPCSRGRDDAATWTYSTTEVAQPAAGSTRTTSTAWTLSVPIASCCPAADLEAYPRTEASDAAIAEGSASTCCSPRRPRRSTPRDSRRRSWSTGLHRARGRRARSGALRGRVHRGLQAVQHRRARRRLVRPEGRPAGRRDPPDGPRPEHARRGRGRPDGARSRRPRALLPQRPPRPAERERALSLTAALTPPGRGRRPASATPSASARPPRPGRRRRRAGLPRLRGSRHARAGANGQRPRAGRRGGPGGPRTPDRQHPHRTQVATR